MLAGKIYKAPRPKRSKKKDAKQDRRIKKLENIVYPSIEWKSFDVKSNGVNIPNSGYQNYPMFQLAKGDTNSTREGDKVSLRHGTLHLSLTRGDTSNIIRVLLVSTPSATSNETARPYATGFCILPASF